MTSKPAVTKQKNVVSLIANMQIKINSPFAIKHVAIEENHTTRAVDHLVDRRIPRRVDVHLVLVPVGYEPAPCVAYRAALEAIASGPDEGYVLVLVPDEDDDDVLAEVYPLLAAFDERLRGFDQVSAGCLPQNCGPRTLAVPPPLARSWPAAPAEEWCFEVYGPSPRGPFVAYADLPTGLFTREGAQRYLDAFRPGDFVLQNAPARCVACSLNEDEWMCQLREDAVASERQLRRLRFPPVPRVTLYQVFRRPVPADIVAQNLANIPIPVRYSFIYDGVELRDYFVRHSDPRLLPLFDSLKFMAWKVDLWRYCRLYEEGGLYLDARAGAEIPAIDATCFRTGRCIAPQTPVDGGLRARLHLCVRSRGQERVERVDLREGARQPDPQGGHRVHD